MKRIAKPLAIAVSAVAFSLVSLSMPAQAMSVGHAEKILLHWVKKDAKKVEKISKPVADAAKGGEKAIADYCKAHTEKCIDVALELAALSLV
ncbi:MAG: hypothetical protein FIB05_10895 [Betaproteobacteria bacterium]|nr:hypothetical protein [Betaproteobacteria bacterium]PWB64107.1 MAG: hypothetical protein C3F16_04150 [Betaproteobacteria bacterium]